MRTSSRWALAAALAALTFGAPTLVAQSQQGQSEQKESLAEAARKARAQKKAPAKPAKVLTNDDVEKGLKFAGAVQDTTPVLPGQAEAAPEAQGKPGERAEAEKEKHDEKYWRQRFAAAHEKLAQAERELNILEREWQKGQTQYYADPQKALKEQYNRKDLNDRGAQVEAKKKEIAKLKQDISDLEDELRREGGDPGWAR
jgi:hypothetical protein